MNTPAIYKIADTPPVWPCWLWPSINHNWQRFEGWRPDEHIAGKTPSDAGWTHWCHSDTRPTVTPEAEIARGTEQRAEKDAELAAALRREDAAVKGLEIAIARAEKAEAELASERLKTYDVKALEAELAEAKELLREVLETQQITEAARKDITAHLAAGQQSSSTTEPHSP